MIANQYYLRAALTISATFFFLSVFLGEFYPFLKSLFLPGADSTQAFAQGMEGTRWLKLVLTSLAMGAGVALYKRYKDKKSGDFGKNIVLGKPAGRKIGSLSDIKANIIVWWQKTGQHHWSRWGIWVWILICCGAYVFVSNFWADVWTGWNAGHRHEGDKSIEYYFVMLLLVPLVLALICGAGIILGGLHYLYIYRPIFRSYQTANIVLYVIVCILVYDFFLADYVFEKLIDMNEDGEDDTYAYMIWASSLMFSIVYDYKKNEDTKKALEKERNEAQIQALKAQINPHFLFNTLNNLYGTALVEESPKTAGGIQQLAQIMRHAVESSQHERIEIGKEIRFLHDYVELQQIRLPKRDNIRIDTRITWDEEPAEITPLILMTFVENAFKYGINPTQESFVAMNLTIEKKHLTFACRNSIVARTQLESGTGMGVENTVKRLNLLYPDRHTISIDHTDAIYEVFLTLQLT